MSQSLLVLVGATTGLGLTLVWRFAVGDVPALRASLARASRQPLSTGERSEGGLSAWKMLAAERLHLARLAPDLLILGESMDSLMTRKIGYALSGLAFPGFLVGVMSLLGASLPLAVPVAASVVLFLLLFVVPDVDLHRRAIAARVQFRYCVCTYLELVALERAADAGAIESLERAAAIGGARPFLMIDEALQRSRLSSQPAWSALATLSEQVGVAELADVADIMRLSGEDGAAVYSTLRARAGSLRTSLLTESAAQANAASEHMVVPVALLGIAFMVLIGYPAFARIVFG
jgi:hypothetical protein